MLVEAAYSLVLWVLAEVTHRPSGRDVDVSHFAMGLSMAGMFIAQWAFGPPAVWEIIFSVLLAWFLVRSFQSVQQYGLHLPHFMIHAVMSVAMLLMYLFPMAESGGRAVGSMSSASGVSRADPGLSFLLALVLLTSAVFTLASPNKGASHHGTHNPAYLTSAVGRPGTSRSQPRHGPAHVGGIEHAVAKPWLEDASHALMCIAMGFMLILMI